MAWISFGALPCKGKNETWWQLTSRYCWKRVLSWLASELLSFIVGLRTFQHPVSVQHSLFYHRLIDSHTWTTRFGWSSHHQVNQNLAFFVVCNACNLASIKCAVNGTLLRNFQFNARRRTQAVKVANQSVIEWDTQIVRLRYSVHASTR